MSPTAWLSRFWRREQCRFHVDRTDARCPKLSIPGSRFCWHHRFSRFELIGGLATVVLGALIHPLSRHLVEQFLGKTPRLEVSLDGHKIGKDSVFIYPRASGLRQMNFFLLNKGKSDAQNILANLKFSSNSAEFLTAAGWTFGPAYARIVNVNLAAEHVLPPDRGGFLPPIVFDDRKVFVCCCRALITATGARAEGGRIHFVFSDGVSNVVFLEGKAAKAYLLGTFRVVGDDRGVTARISTWPDTNAAPAGL